jgi:hypothetical protein
VLLCVFFTHHMRIPMLTQVVCEIKHNHFVLGSGHTLHALQQYAQAANLRWAMRTSFFETVGAARGAATVGRTDQRAFTAADVEKVRSARVRSLR